MKKYAFGLVMVLCIVAFVIVCRNTTVLTMRDAQGTLLFATFLPENAEFGICFTHSVALSPVEEWFHARDGHIALRRTVYQDFGAGLPHEPGEGQRMSFNAGRIEITGYTLVLPRLDVRVGRVAEHRLVLPSGILPLRRFVEPGMVVTFAIENTMMPFLLGVKQYLYSMGCV